MTQDLVFLGEVGIVETHVGCEFVCSLLSLWLLVSVHGSPAHLKQAKAMSPRTEKPKEHELQV